MRDAIEKFQKEAANLDGTSILLNMTVEVAAPPEESHSSEVQEREPKTDITSVRGVLAPRSRIGRKNDEKRKSRKPPRQAGWTHELNHELVRIFNRC